MTNDFLFELGCEELPSGSVWPLADALRSHFVAALSKAGLQHGAVRVFATPRRLALLIFDLQEEQAGQLLSRRGPALSVAYDEQGQASPALVGFAKSCGVSVDALKISKTDKGEWLVYESMTEKTKTCQLLPLLTEQVLTALPLIKPMRWGNGNTEFARPVHWAVMLFGKETIPCEVLGVTAGRLSYGHRFHHPQSIEITAPKEYERLLQSAFVMADFAVRRSVIVEQVTQLAVQCAAQTIMPDELVDEVTSIVEWPQALFADFDKRFLEVPAEALIAAMQSHQKCFALRDNSGNLLPHFIAVANIASSNPEQVIEGNQKVMEARLSDAAFFFEQDKKNSLNYFKTLTEKVIFQAHLGSLEDKLDRLQALMRFLATSLSLNTALANRAAELSKSDLMTGMVGEFPDLQGIMGYYYARHQGEAEAVSIAIKEQYLPRFAADELPNSALGLALSLADRLDTLVGIFAIGQKPSGVKDPFKLRRHALAIVRLLLSTEKQLQLSDLLSEAFKGYTKSLPEAQTPVELIKPFILERLQSYYQSQGIRLELVQAVRARQEEWLYDFDKRLHALIAFSQLPQASSLAAACKRVSHLLATVPALANIQGNAIKLNETLFEQEEEKSLFADLCRTEHQIEPLYLARDYVTILTTLANLRESVDAFFDRVMVMVDNEALKANRLCLLARLQSVLQGVADISFLSAA